MAEDDKLETQDLGDDMQLVTTPAENPMILDQVDYVYTSYAQFIVTGLDFRIAFADRMPPEGKVKPSIGIIMTHEHAKTFLAQIPKMQRALEKLEKASAQSTARSPEPPTQEQAKPKES